ncbi:MAG: hypothetical protein NZ866_02880 [Patescibacteria group bacterium]|nr:hypothetical protein [Patescibacteria group bacterium]
MTKIIPAINAQSFEEIRKKIEILKDLTTYFHLDVASLEFTGYQTWQNAEDLNKLLTYQFDLHLMISLKPQEILKWSKENVKNFILHLEASTNPDGLLKMAKKTKRGIFIAWPPGMELSFFKKYLPYVNGVLILGVMPGKSGQKIFPDTFYLPERLKPILKPKQKIIIDGGVNRENIHQFVSLGVDYLVMASAIFNTENPANTYQEFNSIVKKLRVSG